MEHIGNVARRVLEETRDRRAALAREQRADGMPEVQPHAEEETRSVFERDGQGRRGGVDMLALRGERR
jgi:hypothetical protein